MGISIGRDPLVQIRFNLLLSVSAVVLLASLSAAAQGRSDVFGLGEITVLGSKVGHQTVGGSVVSRQEMWRFEKLNLEQAINLAPGVNSQFDSNGRRNESDIFVRGFGRAQVPLMVDGVRIYLPADNRLDFTRFLTGDVAEIQIQKGYASVIDGPGAMGGLVNLVSRTPTKLFEAEVQAGVTFGDGSETQGWNVYATAGTRQEKFYVSGSFSSLDKDFWSVSDDYRATATSMQQGRARINSDSNDWRANIKAGFTPNDTDEYTINYTRQQGEKGGLLNVYNNPQVPPNSFWRWPQWDVQSASVLTNTAIGHASYVKAKFYYNTFDNLLSAFDDITYTTQSANGRFNSYYADEAYGTSVEAGTELVARNSLKFAFHYRDDAHDEYSDNRPTSPANRNIEPVQRQSQETWSVALQNTVHVADAFDIVGGISYDKYKVTASQDFNAAQGLFSYPRGGADAFNWQAAAVWNFSPTGELHASVSDRARFPIFFELYSTRFGTAIPNPNLGPERATNLEVGVKEQLFGITRVEAAAFYSDVRSLIQTVQLVGGATPQTQTRNVGDGAFYGFEVAFDTRLLPQLDIGGNYTYTHREITDAALPNVRATGVPQHKAMLYAAWRPLAALTVTPSLELASNRWSDRTTSPAQAFPYIRTGSYELVNLQAEYAISENVEVALGAKNLLDTYYELSWGLPQQGRNFYAKARVNF
jgi:iron complex outermembrane recepter protein